MELRCPHCKTPIEVPPGDDRPLVCPACNAVVPRQARRQRRVTFERTESGFVLRMPPYRGLYLFLAVMTAIGVAVGLYGLRHAVLDSRTALIVVASCLISIPFVVASLIRAVRGRVELALDGDVLTLRGRSGDPGVLRVDWQRVREARVTEKRRLALLLVLDDDSTVEVTSLGVRHFGTRAAAVLNRLIAERDGGERGTF